MRDYWDTVGAFVFVLILAALVAYAIYRGVYVGPAQSN